MESEADSSGDENDSSEDDDAKELIRVQKAEKGAYGQKTA